MLPLGAYTDEPVTIRLDDIDSSPIAVRALGALAPRGAAPFRRWQFRSKANGIQRVLLKDFGGGHAAHRHRRRPVPRHGGHEEELT